MSSLPYILFAYFAAAILGLSLLAVNMRNPVHSVLMVLAMFFHMAGIYLTLNAEFLAAVQIIVYAGAILVLYLFVVFLVNLKEEVRTERFIAARGIGLLLSSLLLMVLLAALYSFHPAAPGEWTIAAIRQVTDTKALGSLIFTTYLLPFEITGLILLVAVVGGIVLASPDRREPAGLKNKNRDAKSVQKEVLK